MAVKGTCRCREHPGSPKATEFDGIHGVRTSFGPTHDLRKQFIWAMHLFVVQYARNTGVKRTQARTRSEPRVNGLQVLVCSVREAAAQSNGGATVDQVALGAFLMVDRISGG
ncbi:hypothetical protein TKK_0015671 [Trichogramma kaykai]